MSKYATIAEVHAPWPSPEPHSRDKNSILGSNNTRIVRTNTHNTHTIHMNLPREGTAVITPQTRPKYVKIR